VASFLQFQRPSRKSCSTPRLANAGFEKGAILPLHLGAALGVDRRHGHAIEQLVETITGHIIPVCGHGHIRIETPVLFRNDDNR